MQLNFLKAVLSKAEKQGHSVKKYKYKFMNSFIKSEFVCKFILIKLKLKEDIKLSKAG